MRFATTVMSGPMMDVTTNKCWIIIFLIFKTTWRCACVGEGVYIRVHLGVCMCLFMCVGIMYKIEWRAVKVASILIGFWAAQQQQAHKYPTATHTHTHARPSMWGKAVSEVIFIEFHSYTHICVCLYVQQAEVQPAHSIHKFLPTCRQKTHTYTGISI